MINIDEETKTFHLKSRSITLTSYEARELKILLEECCIQIQKEEILNNLRIEKEAFRSSLNKFDNNETNLLMIHKLSDNYKEELNILQDYILTFDDGNYHQYLMYKKIRELDTNIKMIFFISTGIICDEEEAQTCNTAQDAHTAFHLYNSKKDFMKLSQIKELSEDPNVIIGVHGHVPEQVPH